MKFLSTFWLFLSSALLFGQDCDCASQLSFAINYYEKNNPAFEKIKADSTSYEVYLSEVQKIKTAAKSQADIDLCIIHLDRYVTLLKDHHSDIGFNLKRMDLSTPELIADFKKSENYQQYKKITIDTARLIPLLRTKKTADIEGIYSNGTNILFGIMAKENNPDNYIGVVLKNNKLLDVGHVLMELTGIDDNTYNISYNVGLLGFNFQKIFKRQKIQNGNISSFGFSKTNPTTNEKEYEFKALNDSANYIRLSSFDGVLNNELDSFYNVIDKEVMSKPYLIIDIRNNGGGSEKCYLNLLPYAYTKPFKIDSALIWVSPENIQRYTEVSSESNGKLIERMKAASPYTFIPFSENAEYTWSLDSSVFFPRKIAMLFDRGTASAAEGMIHYFMQSDKVITIGENSGGYIGYGNVMTAKLPCNKFTIRSTTTKYFEKSKYEFIGIEPMYKISKEQDWIQYAEKLLNQRK